MFPQELLCHYMPAPKHRRASMSSVVSYDSVLVRKCFERICQVVFFIWRSCSSDSIKVIRGMCICLHIWFHFTFPSASSSFIALCYIKKKSPAIVHVSQSSCKEPGAMERPLGWKTWDSLFTHSFTLEQSLLPSFLIHNIIILSPCLPVRDVVRLRKTIVWKQFLFLCHLPLSISTPQFQSSLYSYISIYLFLHFHPGMVFILCCGGGP